MQLAALTFLSPSAGVVALAVALPLAALVVAERRLHVARALLGLVAPAARDRRTTVAALAAVPLLLGVAATQPVVRTQHGTRVRTDAEALYVLDISRSMLASSAPGSATRLARARRLALGMRSQLGEVPSGVATVTDRLLPDLFPTGDPATFDSTVQHVSIEQPPPQSVAVTATTFAALAGLGRQGYFAPTARRRLVVLLTDGESQPFSPAAVARGLRGASLLTIQVWDADERVYGPNGRVEPYRPDDASTSTLAGLAAAAGGRAFSEDEAAAAASAARAALGAGPTSVREARPRTTPLAPYVAAAAVFPLLVVLRRRNL
jgi:hypothetical protein